MKASQLTLAMMVGLVAAASWSSTANAVTVRAGGASAGTPFASEVPLGLCASVPTLPILYKNDGSQQDINNNVVTSGKLFVWRCTVPGFAGTTIFKYSATGSSDGINKINNAAENYNCAGSPDASKCMTMLPDAPSNCVADGVNPKTGPSGKQWNQFVCSDNEVFETIHIGTSDVEGTSFGQTGPFNVTVNPLPATPKSDQAVIVPFNIVVGENVARKDNNGFLQKVDSLSRTEVEALFSKQVTDWKQLGYTTGDIGTQNEDANSPITICQRTAGSGTKAAFDQTVMKDATEFSFCNANLSAAGTAFCGTSNQDVRDCIIGNAGLNRPAHPNGVGYMEAEQAETEVEATGKGYVVKVNGYWVDPSVVVPAVGQPGRAAALLAKKKDLRCGRHLYWVGERFNTRDPASADANTNTLIGNYINLAKDPATINVLPSGNWWEAPGNMFVSKNLDAGPIQWKAGAHADCND